MKFTLEMSASFLNETDMKLYEQLGFKGKLCEEVEGFEDDTSFKGQFYCSGEGSRAEVEISSLEELLAFQKKWGPIIIRKHWNKGKPKQIAVEIYNDYR